MGRVIGRLRHLRWVPTSGQDVVVAGALSVGALVGAGSLRYEAPLSLAAVFGLISTTAVGWRRRWPLGGALVALGAMLVYQRVTTDANMVFEPLAVVLTFYMLGREATTRRDLAAISAALAGGLGVCAAISANSKGGLSPVASLMAWGPIVVVPTVAGIVVARRARLADELAVTVSRLTDEQQLRGLLAAEEERNRVARELHDIVAHSLSVMVIQAGAVRMVTEADPGAGQDALRVIAATGREAMADLRRIMGVLRRDDDVLVGGRLGVEQIGPLVDRVQAAGMPVQLIVKGDAYPLPALVSTTVYRLVQEGLTNSIKHAAKTAARVVLEFGIDAIDLEITDTGTGERDSQPQPLAGSGQGLVGMHERVSILGGELQAGPRPGGGWSVRARIPLVAPAGNPGLTSEQMASETVAGRSRRSFAVYDVSFALLALAAVEIEAVLSPYRQGSLALNAVLVGLLPIASIWRRRAPLRFLALIGFTGAVLSHGLASLHHSTVVGSFALVVGMYTVAAYGPRRRATFGLIAWIIGASAVAAVVHARLGDLLGAMTMSVAVWACGRVMRRQRTLAADLEQASSRLRVEAEDRSRLAVAGERTRIARELHALVATGVVAMIVQAESAENVGPVDTELALTAATEIERCGRQALTEMRHILGALRAADGRQPLQPQPGLAEIHDLMDQARADGKEVELSVEAMPNGSVHAGVELIAYRIVQEILNTATDPVHINMRFGPETLELNVTAAQEHASGSLRELLALCDGQILPGNSGSPGFAIVLPRSLQAALA
jgi:signal transduction histidine kinase